MSINYLRIAVYNIMLSIIVVVFCMITKPDRLEKVNAYNEIWTNGVETTGTMTKIKQKMTDTDRTIFQMRVRLEYEVEGMRYETVVIIPKKEFKKLDPDKDGVATVNLCYDAEHPSRATVEPAVKTAQKMLTMTRVSFWVFLILGVLNLMLVPSLKYKAMEYNRNRLDPELWG